MIMARRREKCYTTGRGNSHMKVTDMFVVSFRGVNYAFWLKAVQPELRCPDVTLIFLAIKVRLMVAREKKNLLVVLLLEFF